MKEGTLLCFTVLLTFTIFSCKESLLILTYNANNLFDDVDNGTEYRRFDPENGKWDREHFERKLRALEEVIKGIGADGPDIVALQEVENRYALDRLCDGFLNLSSYTFRVLVPSPGQAVHCAVLSRFPIKRAGALDPGYWNGQPQRFILEVEIEVKGHTLFIFNNHWKSKSGGAEATEPARLSAAAVLVERIRSILIDNPDADIVVTGDFNENVDENEETEYQTALVPYKRSHRRRDGLSSHWQALYFTADPLDCGLWGEKVVLYEPWYEVPREERGSFVYKESWQTPDHAFVSAGLFDSMGLMYKQGGFKVVRSFPKRDPYSDHLPLLMELVVAHP